MDVCGQCMDVAFGLTNGFLLAGSPDDLKMDKAERPITEGEMMKDFDFRTKRYATPVSKKYTAAQLNAHIGKNAGLIFVSVPMEWVKAGNTPRNRLQITNRIGPLFAAVGESLCCHIGEVGKPSKPTGVISLKIQKLNADGANRLARGFLRLAGEEEATR